MTVYTSSAASPIADDGGGKYYATYFFVNGPYNPNLQTYASTSAPSTTQFCRQCHFGEVERSQQHQQHHDAVPVRDGLNPGGEKFLSPFFELEVSEEL